MFLNKTYTPSKSLQFLWLSKLNYSLLLILMALSFPVFAQEVEDELPAPFFGNWVEDLSECEAGSYFSIADSEIGLLVFGLGWSSTEVKVEKMGDYYMLYVDAISEGGDFQSEIKVKMGDDGNLFFIDSDSEEKELVKCDPIESEEVVEFENEEITEGDEVEELDISNAIDMGSFDSELPPHFFGDWVEDVAQCGIASTLSIAYSEEGLFVSSLEWYSKEVKVIEEEGIHNLLIKGLSDDREIEIQISLQMDEYGRLLANLDGEEIGGEILLRCGMNENEEIVELSDEEMIIGDVGLDVMELEMDNSLAIDTLNIELLQGKWQSLEDEASFMVIEGDRMKNYYGGMDDELDNEMIMISDTCMNESDSVNDLPEEKNRYLSNPNLDMCWYIEYVDSTSLSLIYMATGNTLTYRRVE
ncbi:MAG: hypothetical protein RLZZ358_536 [Bacteroidota bacterium]